MKKESKFFLILMIIALSIGIYSYDVRAAENYERKIVYLTFDDGPSLNNTDAILDILSENKVRATFCVVGTNVNRNKVTMKRLSDLNMAIMPHCNNHTYKELYSSKDYYIRDLNSCIKAINTTIGKQKNYNMVRMPGGSTNTICNANVLNEIKNELKSKNIYYLDWTVDSGDATASQVASNIIKSNINKYGGKYKIEVVLMHDLENKKTTTTALQDIIDNYKKLGYEFKTIDEIEDWEMDYLISNHVINK
ncbi:polysaccharide deacetylase family protein [Clostridium saccharobutylicum]|uniref:Bifunctional xylanase/deacetylase n=1 Tax=Clostridium saccharobutylicum TaxID=169679 RepID=A0A1S8NAN0_CLOSA|nr:polysaccharide deacetylase family protein [Clostridium saccharobutylicum]OOM13490.1 bifunctional xylanase/deacetylase precursor [Clostridium saccharobutylicum]